MLPKPTLARTARKYRRNILMLKHTTVCFALAAVVSMNADVTKIAPSVKFVATTNALNNSRNVSLAVKIAFLTAVAQVTAQIIADLIRSAFRIAPTGALTVAARITKLIVVARRPYLVSRVATPVLSMAVVRHMRRIIAGRIQNVNPLVRRDFPTALVRITVQIAAVEH